MKWQCEIWITAAQQVKTGDAFREWQKSLISAFSEFDPPPSSLLCKSYNSGTGEAHGEVFFHVEAETQFQALEKRKHITDRMYEGPLNRLVRIHYLCDPTTHF